VKRRLGEPNPVLVKELRGRMRGMRAFSVLTVYLLLLSCFTTIIYAIYSGMATAPGGGPAMAYLGKVLFSTIVLLEIFMVTFITPAFTAGAISGERERKTYEILRTTLLPARRLVLGKLGAALTYMVLLILTAVPMESVAFVLGGVVAEELALALLLLLVTAFSFAALGLFFSSLVRTTLVATALTYATALLVTVGLPVLLGMATAVGGTIFSGYGPIRPSPTTMVILGYTLYLSLGFSPITAAASTEVALMEEGTIWFLRVPIGARSIWVPSAWMVYTVVYLLVGAVLVMVAIRRVRRQETR